MHSSDQNPVYTLPYATRGRKQCATPAADQIIFSDIKTINPPPPHSKENPADYHQAK